MKTKILFVNQQRQDEVNTLRTQAYAKASGFTVDLNSLHWKPSDDESYVMAAESNHQLVSTMRGEVIDDLSLIEKKLECAWNFPLKLELPVLLLSRAATHYSHRYLGLNLILRYWFLRFALSHHIRYVLGTFVSGSARENSLHEMGYQFFENTLGWQQSTYRSLFPVTVVALDLKIFGNQALHYCEKHMSKEMHNYYFDGEFPNLRIVRSL
jgi:hypothetical protein